MIENVMDMVDLILVMSVNPGFGGQKFIPSALPKIREIRKMIEKEGRPIDLQVDGGINMETVESAIDAGADVLVAGTATFVGGPEKYASNIAALKGK
jgi:ribulose-phosphate 3-epimerase